MITTKTVFTVIIHFVAKDYGPMPEDDSEHWRSPSESLGDLCMAIESKTESEAVRMSEIGHVYRDNTVCSPYFEAALGTLMTAQRVEKRVIDLIAKMGGRVL